MKIVLQSWTSISVLFSLLRELCYIHSPPLHMNKGDKLQYLQLWHLCEKKQELIKRNDCVGPGVMMILTPAGCLSHRLTAAVALRYCDLRISKCCHLMRAEVMRRWKLAKGRLFWSGVRGSHACLPLMRWEQQLCSFWDDIWLSQLASVKGLLLAQPVSQGSRWMILDFIHTDTMHGFNITPIWV